MTWWANILPIAANSEKTSLNLRYRGSSRDSLPISSAQSADADAVMLVRNRLSRIYFNRNFFSYPLKLNLDALKKLGLHKTISFGIGYVQARISPIVPEKSLEDFLVNRFGRPLYLQFFKEYTEKVWGVPCSEISAEWGAQRIKSLSITKALWHALKTALGLGGGKAEQTSLIEHFVYPKFGPGQMWEMVAKEFVDNGGKLLFGAKVNNIKITDDKLTHISYLDSNGSSVELDCDEVVSTMPIKDLILASSAYWPQPIVELASALAYRDFITVGLLYRKEDLPRPLDDNWIYIQEPGVQVGRVQVFNNWSPYLVADKDTVWLGLEFFCKETDALWKMSDDELKALAQLEMMQIGLVSAEKSIDAVVIRVPKAYPGYFGEAYQQFGQIRSHIDKVKNLFLVGRNGMHRYNNQDHSMLTAKEAADQIISGKVDKEKIWSINIDDEYHEETSKN